MNQTEFDFVRGDQLALIDALAIEGGKQVSGATAKSVLRAIDAHARTTRKCWAAAATIGAEVNRHERTVRRALRYLELIHLVVIKDQPGRPLMVAINWGELSLRARVQPRTSCPPPQSDPGHGARPTPDMMPGGPDMVPAETELSVIVKRSESDKSDQIDERVLDEAERLAVPLIRACAPRARNDWQLVARAAILAASTLSERWLAISIGGVTQCRTRKPMAKLATCLRDQAARLHDAAFDELAARVSVPREFYKRIQREPDKPLAVRFQQVEQTDIAARRQQLQNQVAAL